MSDKAEANNPDMFTNYQLYFRTRSRKSQNYKDLVKMINRQPDIVYPDGWYDTDIDRVMVGAGCVHFGMQEFKHVNNLDEPFLWNDNREYVRNKLVDSDMQIEYFTRNYTILNNKGVVSDKLGLTPIDTTYYNFLKQLKRIKFENGESGKGVFLFIFYAENLEYFSPVNFTGSEHVFGKDGLGVWNKKLKSYLEKVGSVIEPCFDEFLLFLLEAYIRQDFNTLYRYFSVGTIQDLINFTKVGQKILAGKFTKEFDPRARSVAKWSAFCDVMEWILRCIHFDTILDNQNEYEDFVILVRNGQINREIWRRFSERYNDGMRTYRRCA